MKTPVSPLPLLLITLPFAAPSLSLSVTQLPTPPSPPTHPHPSSHTPLPLSAQCDAWVAEAPSIGHMGNVAYADGMSMVHEIRYGGGRGGRQGSGGYVSQMEAARKAVGDALKSLGREG